MKVSKALSIFQQPNVQVKLDNKYLVTQIDTQNSGKNVRIIIKGDDGELFPLTVNPESFCSPNFNTVQLRSVEDGKGYTFYVHAWTPLELGA